MISLFGIVKPLLIGMLVLALWSIFTGLFPAEFSGFPVSSEVAVLAAAQSAVQGCIDMSAKLVDWPLIFELINAWITAFWIYLIWLIINWLAGFARHS